jgi:tetratricopeptide (TPR) repeat protein
MNRRERRAAAKNAQIDLNIPGISTPAVLYEAGLRHMRAGNYAEAERYGRLVLALDAEHADALHLMGTSSFHNKQYDAAIEWVSRAIRQYSKPEYLSTLGAILQQQGRLEEALKTFDKAVKIKPDDAELWKNLGDTLFDLKRPGEAFLAYQHALDLNPRYWDAAYRCGIILRESGQFEEALTRFNRCAELRPKDAQSLHLRAATLRSLNRFEECLADNMRVHELDPAHPLHCNNIGDALLWLGRREEALKWFNKALALQPDHIDALCNKAVWFRQDHRLKEAGKIYERLKFLHPNNARFDRDLAYNHLLMGNFEAGWSGREARWKVPGLPIIYPNFSQPMWLGDQDIEGKTVLIYADEGLGDAIQFARYVPMVAARGARVILVVPDALRSLFSGLSAIQECRSFSSSSLPPAFDMYCPLGSLPLAFRTGLETIPPPSYLPPVPLERARAWGDRLGSRNRLRVGLVWSGNPKHGNDRDRSMPVRAMTPLFDVDATFVSLQKDLRPDDSAFLSEGANISDLTAGLVDFAETAALISCLDVVITVDTSVAHLAATLGRPTWILLPYLPDWRWLLDRDDSPWYPTARLFRQTATREWTGVLDRVRAELVAMISARRTC